jgi:hypothetical protein
VLRQLLETVFEATVCVRPRRPGAPTTVGTGQQQYGHEVEVTFVGQSPRLGFFISGFTKHFVTKHLDSTIVLLRDLCVAWAEDLRLWVHKLPAAAAAAAAADAL